MERLEDFVRVVDGGTIHDEGEREEVHSVDGFSKNAVDVLEEHPLTNSFDVHLLSLSWRKYNGRKHTFSRAARDHIVPRCLGVRILHHYVDLLPWYHERA